MDPVKVFEVDRWIEIAIARDLLEPSSRYREGEIGCGSGNKTEAGER